MSERGSAPGTPIIEVRGLIKRYGTLTAVDGVDLTVYSGEVFGILGPNGAGKTTTLEMIEGLRQPDAGTITVAGYDTRSQTEDVRRAIGVQLQTTALFDYLSAAELIKLFADLYGVDSSPARIDHLLGMVGLREKRDAAANQLSGGQQQRLSIALGLVNDPIVVFLDEPTTGLDPAARRELWQTVRDVRNQGSTVVLTTHYMEEAEILCDRIAVMDHGRVIALDTPVGLIESIDVEATISARMRNGTLADRELREIPGTQDVSLNGDQLELRSDNPQLTLIGLLEAARTHSIELTELRSNQASLEDVFLTLTGRSFEPLSDATDLPDETEKRRFWQRRKAA
ncbi:MAG: ABC transporter ATP-binding protein [Thermomicrobiales bacterium]|nr:ABC transporter ATP-binding protein [Thermomicrobiales bacterium]MCO5221789.1 ABC transporter ATP-binding protein [Thermomicrobiales bacterium]